MIHSQTTNQADINMDEINHSTLVLDQQLESIFYFFAEKILNSSMNRASKSILLKYLLIKLMRWRQRVVVGTPEKTTKKSGYMHWRHG